MVHVLVVTNEAKYRVQAGIDQHAVCYQTRQVHRVLHRVLERQAQGHVMQSVEEHAAIHRHRERVRERIQSCRIGKIVEEVIEGEGNAGEHEEETDDRERCQVLEVRGETEQADEGE